MDYTVYDSHDKVWTLKWSNFKGNVRKKTVIKAYMAHTDLGHRDAERVVTGVLVRAADVAWGNIVDMSEHSDPFWHRFYLVRGN